MTILAILFSLLPLDPCRLGGLMQDDDRSLALYIADSDRQDVCQVDQARPLWPWEVPPEGQ
jgi:hypothetical protein